MPKIELSKYKPIKYHSVKGIKAMFGSTGYPKPPLVNTKQSHNAANVATAAASESQGLSTALDARLELGLETHSELRLKMMLSLQSDTLQSTFSSQLPMPPMESRNGQWSRTSPTDGELLGEGTAISQVRLHAEYIEFDAGNKIL